MSMDNTNDVVQDSSPEKVEAPVVDTQSEVVSEDVKTPVSEPKKTDEKVVPYSRFKAVNDELARIKNQPPVSTVALDVEDYIDISASLEGLDQREKEKLAKEHKLTGKPLSEIRKDEDFVLWQNAYRAKQEKERLTLKPSGTQAEAEKPKTLTERLASASLADKEKILKEAGLYKEHRPRADRTYIGSQGLR